MSSVIIYEVDERQRIVAAKIKGNTVRRDASEETEQEFQRRCERLAMIFAPAGY